MEWRPVYGYEGLYEISDQGEVRRTRDHAPVKRSFNKSDVGKWGGFVSVYLKPEQGGGNPERLHRLVMASFDPDRDRVRVEMERGTSVLHINDVKTDNRFVNLKWGTPKENQEHRKRNKLARDFGMRPEEIQDLNANPWQNTLDFDSPASAG
jgi:hypothetical protein